LVNPIGLYIHIPFCAAKCPYCDFYSVPFGETQADAYTEAVCRALEQYPFGPAEADTVYFGGGTPGLMGPERLGAILKAARRRLELSGDAEITLEANPGTLGPAALAELRRTGFTRVSFGVQSLNDTELASLGRRHTAAQAADAVRSAYDAGFPHISADLMLGIPRQGRESLAATLEALCALPVDHISAYLLKTEPGTPFGDDPEALALPGEDAVAGFYLDCVSFLEAHGFPQYEISNFAKPGGQCRHNLKYWRCEPYLGVGPAAHSFLGDKRFYFTRDLAGFIAAGAPFSLVRQDGEGGGFDEYAMLRLRLREGLNLKEAQGRFAVDPGAFLRKAAPLERRGLLTISGDTAALTPQGFLLSNSVTAKLLYG